MTQIEETVINRYFAILFPLSGLNIIITKELDKDINAKRKNNFISPTFPSISFLIASKAKTNDNAVTMLPTI